MGFFGGSGGGASVDLASPSAIGSTTPNTGAFTTLNTSNIFGSGSPDGGVAIRPSVSSTSFVECISGVIFSKINNNIFACIGRSSTKSFCTTSDGFFAWGPTTINASPASANTSLYSDAAQILALRNGTNAQESRVYRTFTDSSNYERLSLICTRTTRFAIAAENAGTGAARSLEISFYTSASDPTSSDITSGCFSVWKNSGTGTIKLWANDGGTMKSVALA